MLSPWEVFLQIQMMENHSIWFLIHRYYYLSGFQFRASLLQVTRTFSIEYQSRYWEHLYFPFTFVSMISSSLFPQLSHICQHAIQNVTFDSNGLPLRKLWKLISFLRYFTFYFYYEWHSLCSGHTNLHAVTTLQIWGNTMPPSLHESLPSSLVFLVII